MRQRLLLFALIIVGFFPLLLTPLSVVAQTIPPIVTIVLLDQFGQEQSPLGMLQDYFVADQVYGDIYDDLGGDLLGDVSDTLTDDLIEDEIFDFSDLLEVLSPYMDSIEVPSGELCIGYPPSLKADASGQYYVNGAGGPSGEPHGMLVSHTIVDTVTNFPIPNILETNGQAGDIEYLINVKSIGESIRVIEVDTDSFLLSTINQRIDDTLQAIALSPSNQYVVINASFAVVPCERIPELAVIEGLIRSLRARGEFQAASDIVKLTALIGKFSSLLAVSVEETSSACSIPNQVQKLPTSKYVQGGNCTSFQTSISGADLFVAAAGNSGLDFSFYPASDPNAISVSATEENLPFFTIATDRICHGVNPPYDRLCSNQGEVLMPGLVQRMGETYFGTSFAAPRLSLRLAVYIAHNQGDVCNLRTATAALVDVVLNDLPLASSCQALEDTRMAVFQD